MKAIIEFDLNDPHDVNNYEFFNDSDNLRMALSDFFSFLRDETKHEKNSDEKNEIIADIRIKLCRIFDMYEIIDIY